MQELLGRLGALDPDARHALRVVACFDELMAGGVGSRGLVSAAAALAGRRVGIHRGATELALVLDPSGNPLPPEPAPAHAHTIGGLTAWIGGNAAAGPHDAIIIERLMLALLVRFDEVPTPGRRDIALLVDADTSEGERIEAAGRRGIGPSARRRVVAAPLFARWDRHPDGPEDVVATRFGPVHVAIIDAEAAVDGAPLGIGTAVTATDLPRSFRAALVALRLSDPARPGPVRADDFGGMIEVLADLPPGARPDRDETAIAAAVAAHPWASMTIDAVVTSTSLREAARTAGIHHSTMAARVETLAADLGFAPLEAMGRMRLTLANVRWRLSSSRVLELPPPAGLLD